MKRAGRGGSGKPCIHCGLGGAKRAMWMNQHGGLENQYGVGSPLGRVGGKRHIVGRGQAGLGGQPIQ